MLSGKTKNVVIITLAHVISWAILFSLPILLKPDFSEYDASVLDGYKQELKFIFFFTKTFWIGFFYFNVNYLIPHYFNSQKFYTYIAGVFSYVFLLFIIDRGLFYIMLPKEAPYHLANFLFFNLFPLLFIFAISSAYRLIVDRIETKRKQQDVLNVHLQTELSLLKSQVSPHFMFNILNSMVALARKKSENLEDALIKLSHLLRYMLYETDHKVSIGKEIEYLNDYIDLQRLRFSTQVKIDVDLQVSDTSLQIEPMLLIPFVENAFKHGVVMLTEPSIKVFLKATEKGIHFTVVNKYNNVVKEIKDATSGIGLENVRRRLTLLYPNNHKLELKKDNEFHSVDLYINLI